ncbi:hypothetical protein AB0E77_29375 [Streptomyces sp. NPDC032940]|uniref:hypothetical protein n=1 Tax=Streptomyces sp. NPDC032940 TaxID=3155366 RepID=UPI0033CCA794
MTRPTRANDDVGAEVGAEVRELLARALEEGGTGGPSVGTDAVFAAAHRVRRRRRAVLGGVALALVTAGVLTMPGVLSGGTDRVPAAASSSEAELTGGTGRQQRLAALLPAGAGKAEEVSLAVMTKHADVEAATRDESEGPLDGDYAVRRAGGVGLLSIALMNRTYTDARTGGAGAAGDLCEPAAEEDRADCVREELPGGRVLTIWRRPAQRDAGAPSWGEELAARLVLPDGRALFVRDSTGFRGQGALGPLLTSPPLTREQLRALALRPELLAG